MVDEPDQDSYANVESGVDRQRVILEGWLASLADGGKPGPHVSIRPDAERRIVVRADRIDELIGELVRVRDRIVETWEHLPESDRSDLEGRALLAARHRARLDQDRRLFYDRLAERLDAVAVVLSTPMTPKEAARAVATELGLAEEQVLPFVTKIDLLALASRRPGKAAEA